MIHSYQDTPHMSPLHVVQIPEAQPQNNTGLLAEASLSSCENK